MTDLMQYSGDPKRSGIQRIQPVFGQSRFVGTVYLFAPATGAASRIDLGAVQFQPPRSMAIRSLYAQSNIIDPAGAAANQQAITMLLATGLSQLPAGTTAIGGGTLGALSDFRLLFDQGPQLSFENNPLVLPANQASSFTIQLQSKVGVPPLGYVGACTLLIAFEYF